MFKNTTLLVEYTGKSVNSSHSGNLVVCSYNDRGKTGVDIEEIQEITIKEFDPFLTREESAVLTANNTREFFKIWTAKEAVMKANGRGFSPHSATINIMKGLEYKSSFVAQQKQWFVFFLNINTNDAATLVSDIAVILVTERVFISTEATTAY